MTGIGIIGAGGIAKAHAKAIGKLGDRAGVRAVADSDLTRARDFAAAFRVPKVYGDYRELLSDPDVEMVMICAPNAMHAGMTVDALAARKPVLCEKPLASSLSEIDAIEAAQARYGGLVSSVFQWRYGAGLAVFRRLMEEGIAGRILWAQTNVLWRRAADYYTNGPWRGTWRGERGGPLITLAIHAIDAMLSLTRDARSVCSYVANFIHDVEVEDTSASIVRFADGSMASVNVTSANHLETTQLSFVCEKLSVSSNALPYATAQHPWTFTTAIPEIRPRVEERTRGQAGQDGVDLHELQVHDFITRASRGENAPVTVAEARRSIELIAGIYKSGFMGKPVEFPIPRNDPFYSDMNGGRQLSREWPARPGSVAAGA